MYLFLLNPLTAIVGYIRHDAVFLKEEKINLLQNGILHFAFNLS